MKLYKIRRISDGLFSMGGMYPYFSKVGKTWNTIGHLRNHLSGLGNQIMRHYDGCEVWEIEVSELVSKKQPVREFYGREMILKGL